MSFMKLIHNGDMNQIKKKLITIKNLKKEIAEKYCVENIFIDSYMNFIFDLNCEKIKSKLTSENIQFINTQLLKICETFSEDGMKKCDLFFNKFEEEFKKRKENHFFNNKEEYDSNKDVYFYEFD